MELMLKDKIVVVTGGASGIGKSIVDNFLSEGSIVISCDLAYKEESLKGNLLELPLTIDRQDHCVLLKEKIESQYNKLDVLVNNAGISRPSPVEDLTIEDWQKVLDVHMTAPFLLIKHLLPLLKRTKGNIINIASFAAKRSTLYGNNIAYTASKHGILGITHEMAIELAPMEIRVNAIAPGPVETEMIKAHPPERIAKIAQQIPLQRLAKPQEIASAVLFLASNVTAYITGECLNVNGGLYLD